MASAGAARDAPLLACAYRESGEREGDEAEDKDGPGLLTLAVLEGVPGRDALTLTLTAILVMLPLLLLLLLLLLLMLPLLLLLALWLFQLEPVPVPVPVLADGLNLLLLRPHCMRV